MAGVVLVPPRFQFLDAVGNPLANGKVDVYLAGSTTRTPTWQDQGQQTLNTNPIILDANGSCTMVVDDSLTYKLVVKNSANVEQTHAGGDNIVGGTSRLSQMSFLQAGAGAVARSAQSKMRDAVSVKDFGAVGNGTADDTAAIQAAADATPFGTLYFPTGTYKITSPISIVTDGTAGSTRRDRHLTGYGAVIDCDGVGQASGFTFTCPGPWPQNSFSLFVEGLTFGGDVTGAFVDFSNAENFFENLLFEKITTTNAATAQTLFQFTNGADSNLGGVTIRRCAGGDNITNFIRLKGSASYGQFDNFTIEDNSHLGTGSMIPHLRHWQSLG